MNKQTIAVDFDGVLHQYNGWEGADHFEEPYPWAREFLERCKELGYQVIVHTTRDVLAVEMWLSRYRLLGLTSGIRNDKPPAIAYVDDRGVRFDPRDMDGVFADIIRQPWWKVGTDIPEK